MAHNDNLVERCHLNSPLEHIDIPDDSGPG
jgi:hypothetical protein